MGWFILYYSTSQDQIELIMRDGSGNWNIDEGSQHKDGNDFVTKS